MSPHALATRLRFWLWRRRLHRRRIVMHCTAHVELRVCPNCGSVAPSPFGV